MGYYSAKRRAICKAIDNRVCLRGSQLPPNFGYGIDERVVEYPWVMTELPHGPAKILDAGSSLNHKFLMDRLALERTRLTVMTLAPEKYCFWSRCISYVYGDLRTPTFAGGSFDAVVSISTIEHIGLNNTLLYTVDVSKNESDILAFVPAVAEFRRILKPGGLCLITVPYGQRQICEWYQVFDNSLLQEVVAAFRPTSFTVDYFGYSAQGWRRTNAHELRDAAFYDVHTSPGPAPDGAAAARGVACLRLLA